MTYEKLHAGTLYDPNDQEILSVQMKHLEKLYDFNETRPSEQEKRAALLKEMFASIGDSCYIEPPLRSNWGGHHVHFGSNIYCNFNLTLVDDTYIYIGDNVMIGPNVTLATAGHPISPKLRLKGIQYNKPIRIEKNVWIGSSVQVMPGVTIGENSIVGAGSVVTKDIPPNVIAVGNPCKVMREITGEDDDVAFHF